MPLSQKPRDRKRVGSSYGKGRYFPKRKVCAFCVEKTESIDYKDQLKLRRYISDRGKIEPRRKTGTCARHQRVLAIALKRARHIALLPFTSAHIRETGGVGARPERPPRFAEGRGFAPAPAAVTAPVPVTEATPEVASPAEASVEATSLKEQGADEPADEPAVEPSGGQ